MKMLDATRPWVQLFFSLYACLLTGNLLLHDQSVQASICGALIVASGATVVVYFLARWKQKNKGQHHSE